MLVVATLVVGAIGMIVERTIIRWLYGRIIDTMLATWGLSLFLVGLTTAMFGNTTVGLSAPLGSFEIGRYRTSGYTLFVIAVALVVLIGVLATLRYTRAGLIARGTMQNGAMAAALGVNPSRVYSVTFGVGAALTGPRRRRAGAGVGRVPDHRRRLCREVLHHRDRRRRGHRHRHGDRVCAVRRHQPARDLRDDAGVRRGRAARRRHRAHPRPAAGRHRAVLPEEPVSGRIANLLGLAVAAIAGVAVLILTPIYFDLDTGAQPHRLYDHGGAGAVWR